MAQLPLNYILKQLIYKIKIGDYANEKDTTIRANKQGNF